MSEYASTATWTQVAERIRQANRILVTSHAKPDGDAMGSTMALARAFQRLGKTVAVVHSGPIERSLLELAKPTPIEVVEKGYAGPEPDLIFVVDTGSWSQLEALAEYLRARRDRVVGIDHHARGDDVAPMRVVEARCASTTQIIVPLLDHLGVKVDGDVAEAIFVGLATDTGWFKFSSADHAVFTLAARLLAAGVNKERLFALLEENDRPQKLRAAARAMNSTRFLAGETIALMRLTLNDFAETGARPEDLTGIVNEPMSVSTVRMAVLMVENEPGVTKVSFRSKPGGWAPGAPATIDVNEIAAKLGGGGHVQAAGVRVKAPIDVAEQQVLRAIGL